MSEHLSYDDLLPAASAQDKAASLLKDVQTTKGKLRILHDTTLSDDLKIALLNQSEDTRDQLETLLQAEQVTKTPTQINEMMQGISRHIELELLRPDPQRLHAWAADLLQAPAAERDEKIRLCLLAAYNKGAYAFFYFLEECSKLNFVTLSLESAKNNKSASVPPEAFLAPLDVETTLVKEAVSQLRMEKSNGGWIRDFIMTPRPVRKEIGIDMSKASIPKPSDRADTYSRSAEDWLQEHTKDFEGLVGAFSTLSQKMFGEGKEAFITKGTTDAFRALAAEFLEIEPSTSFLAATPGEYLPLFSSLRYRSFESPIEDTSFTENDVVEGIRKHLRSYKSTLNMPEHLIITFSSVLRMGGKNLDADRLCTKIRAIEKEMNEGCPHLHVWVDASQDTRVIKNADVVLYSKRTGSMAVIDSKRYPPTELDDLREAVRMRSGFDARLIARTVASLHGILHDQEASLVQLLQLQQLWIHRHDELKQEIVYAKAFADSSKTFAGRLELVSPDLGAEPANDALLRLKSTHPGAVDMLELQKALREEGVQVSTFSLKGIPPIGGGTIDDLREKLASPDVDAEDAERLVRAFQNTHRDRIAWSLIPAKTFEKKSKKQFLDHFDKAVQAHEFFRLHVNKLDPPRLLLTTLKKTEDALKKLDQTHAQLPDNSDQKSRPKRRRSLGSQ